MGSTDDKINEQQDDMEEKTVLFVEQIDHIANNFEQHWTEHFIERLDHLIADVPEELKAAARQELFRVDFEIHFKKGKRVHTGDYIKCFPHYESDIQKAYQCLMSTRRLGEYEYYELLGRGGMGNVYRGTHRLLGRTVAIKLLNSKIFDIAGGTERFLREIRLAGQQQHPNIVSTEYAGKSGDRYYLVMEFIEGGSVATAIYRNGPVSIPVACEILRQTAQGLQYIFENGFVHRDIKPGNLMISRGGVIKIIDFGLGKFTASKFEDDHALTTVGTTMGSIDYVAPEQLTHAALATIQADIYSLGCVFFHLLTGRAPLESEPMSRDQKLIAHIKGELPPLSRFLKNCPEEIERLYQKMVACDPKDRFAHPSEIVNIAAALASPDDLQELFGSGSFAREHSVMMLNRQELITSHSSQAWKWYIAVTLPLLLLAGYGGYHYYQSAVTETAKENVEIVAEELPEHVIPVVVQDERAEILQFPGYSGRWWFEETPYLLPIIREKLILDDTEPRRLASEIDSSLLPSLLSESEALRPLLAFLVREIETSRSNVTDLEMLTDDYYIETTAMEYVPASVLHTLAVLWHRLSMLRGAPELERRALSHYANAITLYENENTETSRFLAKLCRFDLARLNYTIERNADRFRQELEGIIVDDTDDLTFRVHLQVVPALEQMKLGGNQEAIIEEALQLLKTSGGEDAPHPMLMALHALYADALSRKWKLQLADREWQAVERLAIQIALNTGSSDREARVSENAVMAKLARASLALYHGDLDTARYRYRDLIISIQDTLSSINPSEHARLTRQLARAWEGLADTTLFTPAHFGENLVPNASFFISDAESAYQRARDMNNDPVGNFVLQCKLALLRFSAGLIDENDRQRVWDTLRTSYWRLHSWNTDFERAREYFRLTEAVLGSPENALPLRSYLERSRLNVNPYNRYAGERLRIQLFAIWKLLSSELDHDVSGVQQDIVQFLDPILLRHLVQEAGMRPFLLPFYDLAVRSPTKDDLVQVATRIWTARFQHHVDRTAGLHVVFYFPLGDVEGFALLLTTDSRENQRFGLGVTRQQVLEAARNGETLSLPSELTEIIQMAREMSEAIDISWDDSICWTSTMERFRLTPERWAFDIELNPQRLPSVVRE